MTAKQEVYALLENLPDDITLKEFRYNLYIFDQIKRGTLSAEECKSLSQEEVEKRLHDMFGR